MSTIEIIFYILLLDAVAANLMVYFGKKWYVRHLRVMTRFFPPAKGWTLYYLALVLFIGYILHNTDMIAF